MAIKGGDKMAAKLAQIARDMGGQETKVGWFESAQYPDGTPVAYAATIQEFGAPEVSIPPRSFIRPTILTRKDAWSNLVSNGARGVVRGKRTTAELLDIVGLQMQGDFQKAITEVNAPPLSQLTLMLRKYRLDGGKVTGRIVGEMAKKLATDGPGDLSGISEKPLDETGRMLATLNHTVDKK